APSDQRSPAGPGRLKRRWEATHRALDDVGGRALQGSVDRLALGPGAARRVGVADARDVAFAAKDRLDKAGAASVDLDPLHVRANPGEALEIGADVGRCF